MTFRTVICIIVVASALGTPAAPGQDRTPAADRPTAQENAVTQDAATQPNNAAPDAASGDATPAGQDPPMQDPATEGEGQPSDADAQASPGGELLDEANQKATQAQEALAKGDLKEAASKGTEVLLSYAIPAIVAFVVLIVGYFLASFLAGLASRPIRKRVDETLGRFVSKLVFYLIMIGACLGVLQFFGIGVTSFAAVIAAAGFAVGLAFQGTLSNFAAGIMLLVFRPFKVGDVINAAGITAKVYEIDLFTTVFDTPDNRRIIVPNSAIAAGTIENITFNKERRVDVSVGVDYAASLDDTRQVLTAAAESLGDRLLTGEGRGFQIALLDLGASSVNWAVRCWTTADDFWAAKEQLTSEIKNRLDAANIGIPFPQMDVHLHREE